MSKARVSARLYVLLTLTGMFCLTPKGLFFEFNGIEKISFLITKDYI